MNERVIFPISSLIILMKVIPNSDYRNTNPQNAQIEIFFTAHIGTCFLASGACASGDPLLRFRAPAKNAAMRSEYCIAEEQRSPAGELAESVCVHFRGEAEERPVIAHTLLQIRG